MDLLSTVGGVSGMCCELKKTCYIAILVNAIYRNIENGIDIKVELDGLVSLVSPGPKKRVTEHGRRLKDKIYLLLI